QLHVERGQVPQGQLPKRRKQVILEHALIPAHRTPRKERQLRQPIRALNEHAKRRRPTKSLQSLIQRTQPLSSNPASLALRRACGRELHALPSPHQFPIYEDINPRKQIPKTRLPNRTRTLKTTTGSVL